MIDKMTSDFTSILMLATILMNRAARIENVIFSHIRDCSVFHTVGNEVIIKIPLYREQSLVLHNVTLRNDEIIVEGKLAAVSPKDFCNAYLENEHSRLA